MDYGRRMTVNLLPFHEDIEAIRSYTLLKISYFDFKIWSYNVEYDPESDPESISYNADTADLEAG